MAYIVGISGKAESGKDLVASFITTVYPSNYYRRAFADSLKRDALRTWAEAGALEFTGGILESLIPERQLSLANHLKDTTPAFRNYLQEFGARMRATDPDYWITRLFHDYAYEGRQHPGQQMVVPDVRYRNEVAAITDRDGMVLRIERPGHENRLTPEQRAHSSETELDDYRGGTHYRVILNDGGPDVLLRRVLAEVDALNGWRR